MVHKRYIKRGGKVYGPYLYNSKRINGKVKNEYLGIDKTGEWKKAGLMISFFVVLLLGIVYAEYGIMSGISSGLTSNLTIWDGTATSETPPEGYWLSNCTGGPASKYCLAAKGLSHFTVLFYANYSNSTVGPIIGNCSIRFNYTGEYTSFMAMNYSANSLYEFNYTFDRRGNFTFQVNCTNSTYDTLNTTDAFEIRNSAPYNTKDQVGNTAPPQSCTEDTICTYNASTNFTDDDINDRFNLTFSANTTSAVFLPCISIDSAKGVITIRCTNSSQAGSYDASATARDLAGQSSISLTIPYTITAVNDKPIITASTLS